jgi:hypothetical protein
VHVCQRWRSVVFGSPRRLNLQLVCTPRTPVLETLDIWPAFPLVVHCYGDYPISGVDNILAALKYRDRVRKIHIRQNHVEFPWEEVMAVMQVPFPELTGLILESYEVEIPVLPDTLLGGYAPRLQLIDLAYIQYPGLRTLLLSATHLVDLWLWDSPLFGYIPPEVMVSYFSTSTSLESFTLQISNSSPTTPPQNSQPLSIRTVLPALTHFTFTGNSRYLEDIVARIDCPKLNKFMIDLYNEFDCDMPQLDYLISRTPSLQTPENAPHVNYI